MALSAAGLLAAACGGSSSGGNAAVGTSPTATSTQAAANGNGGSAVTLTAHKGPAGTYLTTAAGMSIYVFAKDTANTSNCDASCTVYAGRSSFALMRARLQCYENRRPQCPLSGIAKRQRLGVRPAARAPSHPYRPSGPNCRR